VGKKYDEEGKKLYQQKKRMATTIVLYYMPKCPYCLDFQPVFESVKKQVGSSGIPFVSYNVNDKPQGGVADSIPIPDEVPTVMAFTNGSKTPTEYTGGDNKASFSAFVAKFFPKKISQKGASRRRYRRHHAANTRRRPAGNPHRRTRSVQSFSAKGG
jgi:thiol-disulfide isomerase/thioredoxin